MTHVTFNSFSCTFWSLESANQQSCLPVISLLVQRQGSLSYMTTNISFHQNYQAFMSKCKRIHFIWFLKCLQCFQIWINVTKTHFCIWFWTLWYKYCVLSAVCKKKHVSIVYKYNLNECHLPAQVDFAHFAACLWSTTISYKLLVENHYPNFVFLQLDVNAVEEGLQEEVGADRCVQGSLLWPGRQPLWATWKVCALC